MQFPKDPVCLAGGKGRGDREMDLWVLGAKESDLSTQYTGALGTDWGVAGPEGPGQARLP